MALGDEDYSGDYTDSGASNFDDLSRYSEENQDYIRNNSQTRLNGGAVGDDGKNTAGFGKFGQKTDDDGNKKWGLLKKGEQDASKKPNVNGKGGDKKASLGEKENNVESDDQSAAGKFKNAVQGVKDIKSGKIGKGKGKLKKAGPLMAILALCLGFGGASFFGQMAMPFSLIAQFQENFDSIGVSQNTRSKSFLRFQTGKIDDGVKDCIKAHYFKADEFRVSKRQKSKLAKSGITFEDEGGITVMKYKRANGDIQTIVADPKHVAEGKISFDDAWNNDVEFHNSYKEGARTWRGSVADWFDKSMKKLLARLGISRNKWSDFKKGENSADDVKTQISGEVESDGAEGRAKDASEENKTSKVDEAGEEIERTDGFKNDGGEENTKFKASDADIDPKTGQTKLHGKLKSLSEKFDTASSVLGTGVNVVCGVADFIGAVSMIVAAYQAVQVINMASSFFEGIQKGQIDNSEGSPIHELANSLTKRTSNTYSETTSVKRSGDEYVADNVNKTTRERSAMEAAGISAIYGGTAVDSSDPSVKSFNINTMTNNAFKDISIIGGIAGAAQSASTGISMFKKCTKARLQAAAASAGITIFKALVCLTGVGCIGAIVDEIGSKLVSAGISFLFAALVSVAVAHLVPWIGGMLTRKVVTEVAGEDLGNMLVSGANMYMGQNHQQSGGSVASKESLISYIQERDRVIAENAQYERDTHSPFDITSKYTFVGSLANQMIPLASQMSSITSAINGASTVVGNAVRNITPQSSAASAAIEAQVASDQTEKNCPDMASIGAVADAFCNPYFITDMSTMSDNPAAVVNSVDAMDENLDDEGNIKDDGDLARYIIYCGQRTSPWGSVDQNIAGDVDSGTVGNSIGDAALGVIPLVGDGLDIVSQTSKMKYLGYITGKACVTENDGEDLGISAAEWKDNKKYQRYIEDQRMAEAAGIVEESAVTKFISKYYDEHPLDNSFEGVLARYSGLTKDTVIATLDSLDILAFKAEYEPATFGPYPVKEEDERRIEVEGNDRIFEDYLARVNEIIFDDKRNRNYVI